MINEVLQWCAIALVLLLAAINNRICRNTVKILGPAFTIHWPTMIQATIFPWWKPRSGTDDEERQVTMADDEIRSALSELDEEEDIDVTEWEADFIENVCFKYAGSLSMKQRATAEIILEKYGWI